MDSTQYASPDPMCADMEIKLGSLARRFEKVREIAGADVWCATPEDVIEYILTRRAVKIVPGEGGRDGNAYMILVENLDSRIRQRTLTFHVTGLRNDGKRRGAIQDLTGRREIPVTRSTADAIWFDLEVYDGLKVRVPEA